nr:hypothetical protein Itr_chr14CG22810 [Ipomoea trifida]
MVIENILDPHDLHDIPTLFINPVAQNLIRIFQATVAGLVGRRRRRRIFRVFKTLISIIITLVGRLVVVVNNVATLTGLINRIGP